MAPLIVAVVTVIPPIGRLDEPKEVELDVSGKMLPVSLALKVTVSVAPPATSPKTTFPVVLRVVVVTSVAATFTAVSVSVVELYVRPASPAKLAPFLN